MVLGIDFHHILVTLTATLGPLCVLYAPTLIIERAVKEQLKAQDAQKVAE